MGCARSKISYGGECWSRRIVLLREQGASAPMQGIRAMQSAVGLGAGPGEKGIPGLDRTAVAAKIGPGRQDRPQPVGDFVSPSPALEQAVTRVCHRIQRAPRFESATGELPARLASSRAIINGAFSGSVKRGASGATRRARSVWAVICENRGPATVPP